MALLGWSVGAWAARAPVTVSPGSPAGTSVGDPCPTFNWGRIDGARSYEVVVYRIGEQEPEGPPVLTEKIIGSALGWTPSLGRCLQPGETYAWSVRADTDEGLSEWSEPVFFEVVSLARPELAPAPEVLPRRTNDGPTPVGPEAASASPARAPSSPLTSAPMAAALDLDATQGQLTVDGEVRTVDPDGDPRLWGKGRPGTAVYGTFIEELGISTACTSGGTLHGLSHAAVDWGSAADACPAGTWVCSSSEIGGCDTERPDDDTRDGIDCDGTEMNFLATNHWGWTASSSLSFVGDVGVILTENGTGTGTPTCDTIPVWCCWE